MLIVFAVLCVCMLCCICIFFVLEVTVILLSLHIRVYILNILRNDLLDRLLSTPHEQFYATDTIIMPILQMATNEAKNSCLSRVTDI